MVLDRMCLITFSLFTILATIGVLTAAPHVIVKWKMVKKWMTVLTIPFTKLFLVSAMKEIFYLSFFHVLRHNNSKFLQHRNNLFFHILNFHENFMSFMRVTELRSKLNPDDITVQHIEILSYNHLDVNMDMFIWALIYFDWKITKLQTKPYSHSFLAFFSNLCQLIWPTVHSNLPLRVSHIHINNLLLCQMKNATLSWKLGKMVSL